MRFSSPGNILISQLKGFHMLIKAYKGRKLTQKHELVIFFNNIKKGEFINFYICVLTEGLFSYFVFEELKTHCLYVLIVFTINTEVTIG